ncbi:MAG: MFS transporter [Phycisphaerales bacterium]
MPTTHPDAPLYAGAAIPADPHAGAVRPAPLWAALVFSFLGSLGTGIVTTGIFFLSKHSYGFSDAENYLLGLVEGVTYIAGAIGAGPLLRRARARFGLSARAVLSLILLALAASCLIPLLAAGTSGAGAKWAVWVLMIVYSPITGSLWPMVESYISGGRSGPALRSAIGRFNITWSSALVLGFWVLGPLVEQHAVEAVVGVGAVHILSLLILPWLGREPGRHLHDAHEPHPPEYRQLLVTFRVLLPMSYLVFMGLTPFLPGILTRLDIPPGWQTPLTATWMASRLVTFRLLERWHGWHGRWYPALAGTALLLGGFAVAVLTPLLGNGTAPVAALLAGLCAFGVGMATIYAAALYYAMEVGRAEVEAGGKHEALIGLGYAGGPACGLAALAAAHSGLLRTDSVEPAVLMLVGGVGLVAGGVAAQRAWRAGQAGRDG